MFMFMGKHIDRHGASSSAIFHTGRIKSICYEKYLTRIKLPFDWRICQGRAGQTVGFAVNIICK